MCQNRIQIIETSINFFISTCYLYITSTSGRLRFHFIILHMIEPNDIQKINKECYLVQISALSTLFLLVRLLFLIFSAASTFSSTLTSIFGCGLAISFFFPSPYILRGKSTAFVRILTNFFIIFRIDQVLKSQFIVEIHFQYL